MENNLFELVAKEIALTVDVPAESLLLETSLAEIGVDSLQALQLVVAFEQATGVQLNEEDLKYFKTVQSIVDLLTERAEKTAA